MAQANKVALVTGASRGIGNGILQILAKNGFDVVGTATSDKGVEKINSTLENSQNNGFGVVMNVGDVSSIEDALGTIKDKLGTPQVLVNNAGITKDNLLMRMKTAEWDDVVQTNLSGVFHVTKACLRGMMKAKWGRIIQIGSVVGTMGNAGQCNYAAAKAALLGFSKSLAREIASRNITVNVVAPGFIETDMTASLNDSDRESLISQIPANRIGKAEDVAHAVTFLASDNASYVTGETIHVNGGMYMI